MGCGQAKDTASPGNLMKSSAPKPNVIQRKRSIKFKSDNEQFKNQSKSKYYDALTFEFNQKKENFDVFTGLQNNDVDLVFNTMKNSNYLPSECISQAELSWTALHYACIYNRPAALEYMLKLLWQKNSENYSKIVNIQTNTGNSPIHLALSYKALDCASILLKCGGIDLSLKVQNMTVLEIAKYFKNYEAKSLIMQSPDQNGISDLNENELNNFNPNNISEIQAKYANRENEANNNQFDIATYIDGNENKYLAGMDPNTQTYKILQECIQNQQCYDDPDFPKNISRITNDQNHQYYQKFFVKAKWLRPHEIFRCKYDYIKLYEDKVEPSDIKQGGLGVCYMLSSLCSIAQYEGRMKKLFVNSVANPFGVYGLMIYPNGIKTEIIIDDFFPCFENGDDPIFAKPNGNELWVMLLEKAWTKFFDNYTDAEGGRSYETLQDLLGCPTDFFELASMDDNQLWSLVKTFSDSNYYMTTSTKSNPMDGLVGGHAYSFFKAYEYDGTRLVKLMNPWGNYEWNGEYGDKSELWTEELKQLTEWKDEDDGVFFMTLKEWKTNYSHMSVAYFRENWKYTSQSINCVSQTNYFYKFNLAESTELNLKLVQQFKGTSDEDNFRYSGCMFEVWKADGENSRLIGDADDDSYYGDKSIKFSKDIFKILEAGDYYIRIKMFWFDNKTRNIALCCYSHESVELLPVESTEGEQIFDQYNQALMLSQATQPTLIFSNTASYLGTWAKNAFILKIYNNNSEPLKVQIQFTLQNLILDPRYQISQNTVQLEIQPNSFKIIYLEKHDITQACNISYKFKTC